MLDAALDVITDETVKAVEKRLNTTPRKCLGYKTPAKTMREDLMGLPIGKPATTLPRVPM